MPNFVKQAIITKATLALCHLELLLIPQVVLCVSPIVVSLLSKFFGFLDKIRLVFKRPCISSIVTKCFMLDQIFAIITLIVLSNMFTYYIWKLL